MLIRMIKKEDYEGTRAIYGQYIDTPITFEVELPSKEAWAERVEKILKDYPYLVCEENGKVIGYAYGHRHRERKAYDWNAELSVYVDKAAVAKGVGRTLYTNLIEFLEKQNVKTVYGVVTVPNTASEALHKSLGFRTVGVFENTGYKDGKWLDVAWFEKSIGDYEDVPPEFIPRWKL